MHFYREKAYNSRNGCVSLKNNMISIELQEFLFHTLWILEHSWIISLCFCTKTVALQKCTKRFLGVRIDKLFAILII